MSDDDFIPHIEHGWQDQNGTIDAADVKIPVHSRILTAARIDPDGMERVLVLEFTSDDGTPDRFELSGAAARIIADALLEGIGML